MAEVAAIAALHADDHRKQVYATAKAERTRICTALRKAGLQPLPSSAPYVLIRKPRRFTAFVEEAGVAGIVVPSYTFYEDERVMYPVGTRDQNDCLLAILQRYL
jgi:histidinol-phosphate/aromatic aminotransferase/cobyric acid decarboxylase-like protein